MKKRTLILSIILIATVLFFDSCKKTPDPVIQTVVNTEQATFIVYPKNSGLTSYDFSPDYKGGKVIIDFNLTAPAPPNSDYYSFEESSNGINYKKTAVLVVSGTVTNFTFKDSNPTSGMSYYRIILTDYDGMFQVICEIEASLP